MKKVLLFTLTITAIAVGASTHVDDELKYYFDRHNVQDEGYEMVANYAQYGDTLLARMPQERLTLFNVGHWRGISRQGTGIERDTTGRIIVGHYEADTLTTGIRLDSAAIYSGDFGGNMANGHGCCVTQDGTYYEGQWANDRRQGFGFAISPTTHLRVGQWNGDRYLGERMHYTGERIYGIDISRYQHEQGKKKFAIDWRRMRITYLGKKAGSGAVDFPVGFVYVKATEGISIHNKYFASDYAAARRQGIRVGAYHFLSTRQSGRLQANYFLSQAAFRHGDLPPMLDIEPSDALVTQMGGPNALFREIRAWISVVEKHTGTRPLLYVNQRFVKKYLPLAPDLKHNYQIWIARYSEYKPDVHLAIWQLTAEGRVAGIRGSVDVNVFNGYAGQWEEFLREETIP